MLLRWCRRNRRAGLGITLNGAYQANTANVTLALYYSHAFYQQNLAGNWYMWTGTGYVDSANPRPAAQPTGGTVAPTTLAGNLTVKLGSPTGQTVYGTMYGNGSGSMVDEGFARTGNLTITNQWKRIAPSLFRTNIAGHVGGSLWQDALCRRREQSVVAIL